MPLKSLEIRNFRVYSHAKLELDPKFNLITGNNASGKTSLLEAIHFLASGKSFRSTSTESILRGGAEKTTVRAEIDCAGAGVFAGISATNEEKKISVGGSEMARMADLAKLLPLLIISPDSHFSFMQGPKQRRSALDWILFHVEPEFGQTWARYQRALQQRNAALRDSKQKKSVDVWGDELSTLGEHLHNNRVSALSMITPYFKKITGSLLGDQKSDLSHFPGWNTDISLLANYRADISKDAARGFTHSGPHRNDLRILINGKDSQEQASHGQNKLLVAALRLAQIACFRSMTNRNCCLLIDDLPAELDAPHREKLIEFLDETNTQVFITATDKEQVKSIETYRHAWFHVEHGNIKKLEKSYKSDTRSSDKVINFPG